MNIKNCQCLKDKKISKNSLANESPNRNLFTKPFQASRYSSEANSTVWLCCPTKIMSCRQRRPWVYGWQQVSYFLPQVLIAWMSNSPSIPALFSSFSEGQKVSSHHEVPQWHPPTFWQLHEPGHLQTQVLWYVQWWSLLYSPQHQNHVCGLRMLPRTVHQETSDADPNLHVPLQLSSEQRSLSPRLEAKHSQRGNIMDSSRSQLQWSMTTTEWIYQIMNYLYFTPEFYVFSVVMGGQLYLSFSLMKDQLTINFESK